MLSPFTHSTDPCFRPSILIALQIAFICFSGMLTAASPARAEKWALLIGIDQYKDKERINSLGAAAADARALKAALVESAGFPEQNISLLVSDAILSRGELVPDRNAILRELAELTKKVKPGDTVFVLYSGHGIETDGKTYLLPYNTDAFDDNTLTGTAIETDKFRERLEVVHAGTLILAFDMCRTNPHKGSKGVDESNPLTRSQVRGLDFSSSKPNGGALSSTVAAAPVVITLFACSPDQQSFEWIDRGRGYFSYFLDIGLRGDAADSSGTVHFDRLAEYVASHVEASVQRNEGKPQTPFYDLKGPAGAASSLVLATGVHPVAAPKVAAASDAVAVDTNATFRMVVSPTGAAIALDGVPISGHLAQINLGIDKTRSVAVRVEAPGCAPEERTITVSRGLNPPVVVMLNGSEKAIAAASDPTASGSAPAAAAAPTTQEDMTSLLRVTADGGARASVRREGGGSVITVGVTAVASTDWRVRATYRTTTLSEGAGYEIRFRARADSPEQIAVRCAAADGDGHNIGLDTSLNVSTEWQEYRLPFRAARISRGANFAPILSLGGHVGTVQIANFSLVRTGN